MNILLIFKRIMVGLLLVASNQSLFCGGNSSVDDVLKGLETVDDATAQAKGFVVDTTQDVCNYAKKLWEHKGKLGITLIGWQLFLNGDALATFAKKHPILGSAVLGTIELAKIGAKQAAGPIVLLAAYPVYKTAENGVKALYSMMTNDSKKPVVAAPAVQPVVFAPVSIPMDTSTGNELAKMIKELQQAKADKQAEIANAQAEAARIQAELDEQAQRDAESLAQQRVVQAVPTAGRSRASRSPRRR